MEHFEVQLIKIHGTQLQADQRHLRNIQVGAVLLHRPPLSVSARSLGVAMTVSDQLSSKYDVVHPRCWRCWTPMVLTRVKPTRFATYKGKFECETCGRTRKRVIKIKSPSISPANSARG